jgi:hypothetical protein
MLHRNCLCFREIHNVLMHPLVWCCLLCLLCLLWCWYCLHQQYVFIRELKLVYIEKVFLQYFYWVPGAGLPKAIKITTIYRMLNPPSGSCFCDTRIGGCRQNRLFIPRSPFIQHPPIKRDSLPKWASNYCISPWISKLKLTLWL